MHYYPVDIECQGVIIHFVELREYQDLARRRVLTHWGTGKRSVCLVAPTGSGKTVMGLSILESPMRAGRRCLWLTHTKDLIEQSAGKLRQQFGSVGIIAAGHAQTNAALQVASVQTLLARNHWEPFDVVVFDECHHGTAPEWRSVVDRWPHAYLLGLTATPERASGAPLGDLFQVMVVAAHYSELIRDGHLVPLRVLRPESKLDRGLAKTPLEAYQKRGEGRKGFGFARSIEEARRLAAEFSAAGIPSLAVDANTERDERRKAIAMLDTGAAHILWSVYALTEGVDVPSASVGILARSFGHCSTLLQAAGRILRPAPGKSDALLLDLPGVTHEHGVPTADRDYTLQGMPLKRGLAAVKVCQACGYCWDKPGACPRCGFAVTEAREVKPPRIYNAELREVYAGAATPDWAKRAEAQRLLERAREQGFSDYWAKKQYEELFLEPMPELRQLDDVERKKTEYRRLLDVAKSRGHKPGWAAWQYKVTYGAWPPRAWTLSGDLHRELEASGQR